MDDLKILFHVLICLTKLNDIDIASLKHSKASHSVLALCIAKNIVLIIHYS